MTNNNNNHYNISSQFSLYGSAPASTMSGVNMGMSMGGGGMNASNNNRKVFIGGLDPSFPDTQLRDYFSKFGKIDEIDLPFDKEKNERRPFCFISFSTEQAAQEVLRLQRHTIGEITVDVKPAKPKTSNNQQQKQIQQQMYDPYSQQVAYANYNTATPSYGVNSYQANDPYSNWGGYNYNPQSNASRYPYPGSVSTTVTNPVATSYQSYPDPQPSSQYAYSSSSAAPISEYYQHYNYGSVPQQGVYSDPNAYGGAYDYAAYYPSINQGGNPNMAVDNGSGQQTGNSPGNQVDYEHDNHNGKAKTSIVSSPTFHPYSRN